MEAEPYQHRRNVPPSTSTVQRATTTIERVEQTLGYMEKCRAKEGHLMLFDRRTVPHDTAADEAEGQNETRGGSQVTVWTR